MVDLFGRDICGIYGDSVHYCRLKPGHSGEHAWSSRSEKAVRFSDEQAVKCVGCGKPALVQRGGVFLCAFCPAPRNAVGSEVKIPEAIA